MRSFITVDGKLRIEAETETEGYALRMWYGESCEIPGKNYIECSPRHQLTLGPQPVHLMAVGDYVPPLPPPVEELRVVYSLAKEHPDFLSGGSHGTAINTVRQWLEPLIFHAEGDDDGDES